MRQMIVLFAFIASSLARPGVTSYAYSEMAPFAMQMNVAVPAMYKSMMPLTSALPMTYAASPMMMNTYAATPMIASPYVASVVEPVIAAAPAKSQYHAQDMIGQAAYGHAEPGQIHNAVQDAAGNKVGSFSHVQPDGSIARTDYVADAMGYRVSSNALPVAPVNTLAPVSDTVEVVAARAAHMAEVEKVKSRSRRAIMSIASYSPYSPFSNYAYSLPYAYGSRYLY